MITGVALQGFGLSAARAFEQAPVAEAGAPFDQGGPTFGPALRGSGSPTMGDETQQVAARRWGKKDAYPEHPGHEGRVEPMALSVRELVRLVRQKNEQILIQDEEWGIAREAVEGAKAIFEPAFVGSYQHEDLSQRNTVRELVSLGFIPVFAEKSNRYEGANRPMMDQVEVPEAP
jgi:hypothetical protein